MSLKLVVLFFLSLTVNYAVGQKKVICYHTNWSQYRPTQGTFFPENIDPNLCTHIIYSFAKVVGNTLAAYEWNDESTDWSKGMYERTIALKNQNPSLKILLAVGGWNHGSAAFSTMVTSDTSRAQFVDNTLKFIKLHKFDGLDLDWEYPSAFDGSRPTDKENFSKLVKELKAAFQADGLLLTAAVAAGKGNIDNGYEVAKICQDLDFINVMTYDLHGTWESFTGHHAAMYVRQDESGDQRNLNVEWVINYWINLGCPRSKLMLGLGTYGRAFRLANANNFGLGAPTSSLPTAGTWTREAGFLSYYEVCQRLSQGWTRQWSNEQAVPYAFQGQEWVGYDDFDSLEIKVEFAKSMGLGGIMFWALDLDDFNGQFCNQGKYPLINKAKSVWYSNGPFSTFAPTTATLPVTTPTLPPTSTTPGTTTTGPGGVTNAPSNDKCFRGDGYYADKTTGCQQYYVCVFTGTIYQQIHYHTCPPGTIFDERSGSCNYANQVTC